MVVRDEQRQRVIECLAAHLLATGLAQSSLRQLADAAGVSDRMLLYYFRDKTEVLASAMQRVAGELAERLAAALPADERLPPAELIGRALRLTTGKAMRPYMRLWIQVVAAAARDEAPFADVARAITAGFLAWIDARLEVDATHDRAATAASILALIDGAALVEICAGEALAARIARAHTRPATAASKRKRRSR